MASKFFHVHHEFRAGKAQQWWETAQAAMAPGGGWDEAVAKNLEAGFYNHSFCPIGPEGPAFCIWEVREGITAEEFQEFIDGPNGVNFGLGAWMNTCREINVEMAGTPTYPRKFRYRIDDSLGVLMLSLSISRQKITPSEDRVFTALSTVGRLGQLVEVQGEKGHAEAAERDEQVLGGEGHNSRYKTLLTNVTYAQ